MFLAKLGMCGNVKIVKQRYGERSFGRGVKNSVSIQNMFLMKMGPLGNVKIVMRLKEEDKKRRVRVRMRKKESRLGRGKRVNEEYRRMYTKRTKERRRENKRKKRTRILQKQRSRILRMENGNR